MAPFFMSENFIAYLKIEKRFSDHTCVAYKNDVNQFFEHFTIAGLDELKGVDNKMIRNWMVHLIDEGLKGVTVNRKLSSLRTYFNWLLKEGELEISPAKSVKGPKTEKRLPVFAQQQELRSLDEIFSNDFEGVRDELIFELLYQTGIRTSELIGLKDIDVSNLSIKVLGKRSKERIIPINEKLSRLIENYIYLRQNIARFSNDFLVLNNGKKIYAKFVYRKINYYIGLVTSLKKKSPHVLRHTFATHMLNNGASLEVLKEILGHASLSATQVYTHNSFTELTNIYSLAHPRGRKK